MRESLSCSLVTQTRHRPSQCRQSLEFQLLASKPGFSRDCISQSVHIHRSHNQWCQLRPYNCRSLHENEETNLWPGMQFYGPFKANTVSSWGHTKLRSLQVTVLRQCHGVRGLGRFAHHNHRKQRGTTDTVTGWASETVEYSKKVRFFALTSTAITCMMTRSFERMASRVRL